jgi:lipopolysaccharide/colanic/teichoic acid biosynthesis glycosyltransferase
VRRLFDVLFSLAVLALVSPILLAAAILVRLTSPGPVFYRAERVGLGMKPFRMFKFRSMVAGADRSGPGISVQDDPRVTRVGRFLRATKIDELPQFFNVLKGDMALVGPRPEAPRFVDFYTPEQRTLLTVRPGITGPAQIEYTLRHQGELPKLEGAEEVYIRQVLSEKLRWDLDYVRTRTFPGDLRILAKTAALVLARVLEPSRKEAPRARMSRAGGHPHKP